MANVTNTGAGRVPIRARRARRAVVAVGAAGLLCIAAACSGGGNAPGAAPTSTVAASTIRPTTVAPTTTTTLAVGAVDLGAPTVAGAQTDGSAGPGPLDPTIQAQIVDAVHTYENAAIGTPLGTGQAAVLNSVLTATAAARLTPPNRDALVDEGMPAMAAIKAERDNVTLHGLTGPDETTIVEAAVDLQISARTPVGSPVTIVRNGSLTFVNDGGIWKIDSFALNVQRSLP
jgi:hypothetical protein